MKKIKVTLNIGEVCDGVRITEYLNWDKRKLRNFFQDIQPYLKQVLCGADWTVRPYENFWKWTPFQWELRIFCADESDSRFISGTSIVPRFWNDLADACSQEDERLGGTG